jgi:hypothetical protein
VLMVPTVASQYQAAREIVSMSWNSSRIILDVRPPTHLLKMSNMFVPPYIMTVGVWFSPIDNFLSRSLGI